MTDSEKQVCNYLRELDLWWVFESPIFVIDEKECGMVWTPDFNVPKLDMYIEVCGTDEFDYEYQKKIYYKNGYRVAFIKVYKEKWKNFLVDMIMDIEEKRHVEVMKVIKALNFYIIARFQHVCARNLKTTTIKKHSQQ